MWREREDLLHLRGVGPILSATLLSQVPELGHLDRKAISKLVGVAPLNRDSGTFKGKRRVWGGRRPLHAVLYMAALVATRHNPHVRDFYERQPPPVPLLLEPCVGEFELRGRNAPVETSLDWHLLDCDVAGAKRRNKQSR